MAVRPRPELDTSPAGPRKEDEEEQAVVPVKKRSAKNKARTAQTKSDE